MILINPLTQKLGDFYRYLPLSPPIGIGTLAGYLLEKGKEVKILDEHISPITDASLDDYVKDLSKPYIFGISSVTAGIGRSYQLAEMIKTRYPDAKLIMGGIHPTVLPEEVLQRDFVDIVVRREGEETLNLLYSAIKENVDYTKLLGISFRDNHRIVQNPSAPLTDLNLLPPFPYHLFAKYPRYNFGFILSARGCPYDCIFCSQRLISGRLYRYVSAERVIEELDLLINKYNQKSIIFVDDNFVVNKERTKRLCNLMYENKFHNKADFHCQTRGDAIDAEILQFLKMAGFKYIDFGIETASERLMKLINKGETVEDNARAVILAKKFGLQVTATFILGLPTETKEERRQAYSLAKKLNVDYARFNNATPYPGTKLFKIATEENRLYIEKDWSNINACGALVGGFFGKAKLPYVPLTTSEKELKRDAIKANLLFYLRPRSVWRVLREGMIPAGWLELPKGWYLKPKEWYYLTRLIVKILIPGKVTSSFSKE